MLFEHVAQLDRHCLPARERHWHVRDEQSNVTRELAIGGVPLSQCGRVAEVSASD